LYRYASVGGGADNVNDVYGDDLHRRGNDGGVGGDDVAKSAAAARANAKRAQGRAPAAAPGGRSGPNGGKIRMQPAGAAAAEDNDAADKSVDDTSAEYGSRSSFGRSSVAFSEGSWSESVGPGPVGADWCGEAGRADAFNDGEFTDSPGGGMSMSMAMAMSTQETEPPPPPRPPAYGAQVRRGAARSSTVLKMVAGVGLYKLNSVTHMSKAL
jgi:hypothetical protein